MSSTLWVSAFNTFTVQLRSSVNAVTARQTGTDMKIPAMAVGTQSILGSLATCLRCFAGRHGTLLSQQRVSKVLQ